MEQEKYIPKTLEEAVDFLIKEAGDEQVAKVKGMTRSEFIGYTHHFLGRNLRNDWMLWYNQPDNPLTDYFTSIDINHGDDRSGMILDSLYRKINGLPIDIEGQVAKYKKHWSEYSEFKDGIVPAPGPYVPKPKPEEPKTMLTKLFDLANLQKSENTIVKENQSILYVQKDDFFGPIKPVQTLSKGDLCDLDIKRAWEKASVVLYRLPNNQFHVLKSRW